MQTVQVLCCRLLLIIKKKSIDESSDELLTVTKLLYSVTLAVSNNSESP